MSEVKELHLTITDRLHEVFVLSVDGVPYLGRRSAEAQARTGSLVLPSMLIGALQTAHWDNQAMHCRYLEVASEDKRTLFREALTSAGNRLHFPYPVLDEQAEEAVCPPAFWNDTGRRAALWDSQETHFRRLCIDRLGQHDCSHGLIHDPACSTGTFINALAEALPGSRCIGSDLSPGMIEHARRTHVRPNLTFHLADATSPVIAPGSCDVLVLRFLNAEVMLRAEAVALFHALLGRVKPGGLVILFGHTPLLFEVDVEAHRAGLDLLSSVGALAGCDHLFQFYMLRKPLTLKVTAPAAW